MSSKEPTSRNSNRSPTDEPDVLLDIPQLKVDEIGLEVEDLKARVSLHAGVGELVNLAVGADVNLGKVKLDIKGVEAQALLKVRLENVLAILDRALSTVDGNPEVLRSLTQTVDQAGDLARRALGEDGAVSGAVSNAVGLVGDTTGRAMGEGGAVSQAASGVSQAAQGVGGASEQVTSGAGQATQEAEGTIETESKVEATDAAKRKAKQLGVDLSTVEGTGSGGRITAGDAESAAGEA